jgi:TRAP-type mannitol/chloroaromatic compound transport system substrate-binding protein
VDFQVVDGHMVWAKEISDRVKAETPHTVNITMQPGGVLLGATEIYEGVAAGAADIGSTCPVYTMGHFPLTMGWSCPATKTTTPWWPRRPCRRPTKPRPLCRPNTTTSR